MLFGSGADERKITRGVASAAAGSAVQEVRRERVGALRQGLPLGSPPAAPP